jgi:membrane protein DedA with SNARE-associated domain
MTPAFLTHLLQTYGYLAVILLVGLESVGIPLPGESTLITAALYAGSTHHLDIALVAVFAAAAAIVGDNVGYALGLKGGQRLITRYGRVLHLGEDKLVVGRYLFRRHGGKVVFFGRFVSVLRTYAAFLAGMNRMPWWKFAWCNAAGGVVWAVGYSVLAYQLGTAMTGVGSMLTIIGLGVTVVVSVLTIVLTRRSFAALSQRAQADEARRFGETVEAPDIDPLAASPAGVGRGHE